MTTHLNKLFINALLMEHIGRVTYAELAQAYRQILEESPAYLLVDGMHMIYSPQVFRHPDLMPLVQEFMQQTSTRCLLLVIPERHDLRKEIEQHYTNLGFRHKLTIVSSRAEGIATIEATQATENSRVTIPEEKKE